MIAIDNGSTLATGGSQMIEILPSTDSKSPLFYQRPGIQYAIAATTLLFLALAMILNIKLKHRHSFYTDKSRLPNFNFSHQFETANAAKM